MSTDQPLGGLPGERSVHVNEVTGQIKMMSQAEAKKRNDEAIVLPLYQCFKHVRAANILDAQMTPPGQEMEMILCLDIDGRPAGRYVSMEWYNKHQPKAGDYFIQYNDGYLSCSPAKAFEEGYLRLGYDGEPAKRRRLGYDGEPAKRRQGRVRLSAPIVHHRPEDYRRIMADLVIVRCESMDYGYGFEYHALCDKFDEVEYWNLPIYEAFFTKHDDGSVTHEWKRQAIS